MSCDHLTLTRNENVSLREHLFQTPWLWQGSQNHKTLAALPPVILCATGIHSVYPGNIESWARKSVLHDVTLIQSYLWSKPTFNPKGKKTFPPEWFIIMIYYCPLLVLYHNNNELFMLLIASSAVCSIMHLLALFVCLFFFVLCLFFFVHR